MCASSVSDIALSHLENHKAAINRWNSGEESFVGTMHAFTSVYWTVSPCVRFVGDLPRSTPLPDVARPPFCPLATVYGSLFIIVFTKVIRKDPNAGKGAKRIMN